MSRHIGICMVAGDMIHSTTSHCLCRVMYRHGAKGDAVTFSRTEGTVLSHVRQKTAMEVVEAGAEWLFWADSDMEFPADTIDRLISWGKPVVAANCSRRVRPISPTARIKNHLISGDSVPVWPDPDKHDLEQVETVGFGIMLIHANVFQEIAFPWFEQPWVADPGHHVGEDIFFCGRLHEAGIPIYVDHGLSWAVKHVGNYPYGMGDVLHEKELANQGVWHGAQ